VRPDPEQPEPEAPAVPDLSAVRRPAHPWGPVAEALGKPADRLRTLDGGKLFPKKFLKRFGDHIAVAAAVAEAGVPRSAPNRAVLCLLGLMVALTGDFDWAGRLLRLAGFMRCPECGHVQAFEEAFCLEDPEAAGQSPK
jgi:hypothetical protein